MLCFVYKDLELKSLLLLLQYLLNNQNKHMYLMYYIGYL